MANHRTRRPSIRHSLADRVAAEQLACQLLDGDRELMARIARAARAPLCASSGPAFDEIANLILSGDDPLEHIGLIAAAVQRELRPRGPTCDPAVLETHGGRVHPMDLPTAAIFDAPEVIGVADADDDMPPREQQPHASAAREAAAAVAALLDRGQNHRKSDHRQKAKSAAALEGGQLWFCGLDWRAPSNNDDDDDDGLGDDGLAPQGV